MPDLSLSLSSPSVSVFLSSFLSVLLVFAFRSGKVRKNPKPKSLALPIDSLVLMFEISDCVVWCVSCCVDVTCQVMSDSKEPSSSVPTPPSSGGGGSGSGSGGGGSRFAITRRIGSAWRAMWRPLSAGTIAEDLPPQFVKPDTTYRVGRGQSLPNNARIVESQLIRSPARRGWALATNLTAAVFGAYFVLYADWGAENHIFSGIRRSYRERIDSLLGPPKKKPTATAAAVATPAAAAPKPTATATPTLTAAPK